MIKSSNGVACCPIHLQQVIIICNQAASSSPSFFPKKNLGVPWLGRPTMNSFKKSPSVGLTFQRQPQGICV